MAYEFLLPDIGEGLAEAEVVRWVVAVGDEVAEDAPLVEVETDKAVVEITSPHQGVVLYHGAASGETLQVGAVLTVIGAPGESWSPADAAPIVGTLVEKAETLPTRVEAPDQAVSGDIKALPLIRKLAKDLGVDLADVHGTAAGGRISREDVHAAASRPASTAMPRPAGEGEQRVRLSRIRRTIADHMERSWREIPHVTTFDTVAADRLLDLRASIAARHEVQVPLETLVVMAVLPVLVEYGEFNASLDGDGLIFKRHYDIGVAADTQEGLIVPVVRRADQLDLRALAAEITRLAAAARSRSLSPAELSGATFTVSNIGAVGGGHGTPIIPFGTTAILSVGMAQPQAVVRNGAVAVARMMPLSLSYDHRVIDGGLGRRFMARLRENLEEPGLFLAS
ncbi:MAG: dihydrolipoamide acetyltransferase family protein [Acidimicrobiia bacterium]